MSNNSPGIKKNEHALIVSLLTLLTYVALYLSRFLDDNRLTSWAWVFQHADAVTIYTILILGIILAFALSRLTFSTKNSAALLFLFSFGVAASFWSESEVIVDASRYFTQAKHLEVYGIGYFVREWGNGLPVWTDLPAVPFLYGLIFKLLGEQRMYIQMFTTLLFSSTVVLTYRIGKILWDEHTGFCGGMLLLGIPYLFTQVPLMLVDVPTMFFLTLSVFLFIKALHQGGTGLTLLSSLAVVFTFFSKYSAWIMLSVLIVIVLVYRILPPAPLPDQTRGAPHAPIADRRPPRCLRRASLVALVSGLLIGIVVLYKFDVFSEQVRLLLTYQKPGLGRWSESFISTFFFQVHPFITIAALYSLYAAAKKKDLTYIMISYLVLLVVFMQIKRIRYIMIIFPLLALMASYGLQKITESGLRRFIVSCIVLSSIIIASFGYLPFLQKVSTANLKNAGRYLDSLDADHIRVFTLPQAYPALNPAASVPILDFFTHKRIWYDYQPVLPTDSEEHEKSSLRFTWEYKNPQYYTGTGTALHGNAAVVVISKEPDDILPDHLKQRVKNYRNYKTFATHEGVFLYRPIVRVFAEPAQNAL